MDRIKALPRGVAHTVLLAICNEPSTLARAIDLIDLLQAPQSPADEYDEGEDEVEIVGVAPMPNRKRKTPPSASVTAAADLFNCERCERPFFASRNRHDACRYHEGELEPDLECGIWDDHTMDPNVWGPIDTPENIREHPEGFYWDCCGKRADDAGCQIDYHVSTEFSDSGSAKRSRLDGGVDGGQGAYAKDAIDVRDDGDDDDDDDDDDSVVEVAAPLVTIDDDIDEDPPEELEDEVEFGAGVVNGQAVVGVAVYKEVKTVVAASDNGIQEGYSGLQAKAESITHAQEL